MLLPTGRSPQPRTTWPTGATLGRWGLILRPAQASPQLQPPGAGPHSECVRGRAQAQLSWWCGRELEFAYAGRKAAGAAVRCPQRALCRAHPAGFRGRGALQPGHCWQDMLGMGPAEVGNRGWAARRPAGRSESSPLRTKCSRMGC